MRSALTTALVVLLSACATEPLDSTACPEPRPQVCTLEFAPTCGVLDGSLKEYSSPCTACSDPAVTGYVSGPCPE